MEGKRTLIDKIALIGNFLNNNKLCSETSVILYNQNDKLPGDFPSLTFIGESVNKRDILLTPYHSPYLICLDYQGNLKWYKRECASVQNFRQIDPTHYSYTVGSTFFNNKVHNYGKCCGSILDITTGEVKRITCLKYGSIPYDGYPCEYHLFYAINPEHYFVSTVTINNSNVNCILQEQDHGKVVWQFETKDYLEINHCSILSYQGVFISENLSDRAHLNAMSIDTDGNILLSMRNIGLIKVNYQTKKIMWVIGKKRNDFTGLTGIPGKQHSLELLDGNIYIYDNHGDDKVSRCIKYILDEKTMTGTSIIYNTQMPATDNHGACIPVDNNILFISHGFSMQNKAYIEEFDFNQNKQNLRIILPHALPMYNAGRGL